MPPRIVPVVMSGGSGTRLWPLSTDARPKQFHALGEGEPTMIQETVRRFASSPVLVCNHRQYSITRTAMSAIGVEPAAVVLEPAGRNTAPVAAIAALLVREIDPEALVLLAPADHLMADVEAFRRAVEAGAEAARERIVVFGLKPDRPETGYGYIRRAEPIGEGVHRVEGFYEKPDPATAERYLASGDYDWNAGIFLFAPEVMLEEMRAHRPDVLEAATQALERARREGATVRLDEDAFARCPSVSVDYAVMEKTARAAVVPCDPGWADVGSWSELWRLGGRDAASNRTRGDVVAIDTQGSLIWSDGPTVGVVGMTDVVVVATADGVLVMPRDRAQDAKLVVEALKARGTGA
ncbi:MAG TPA: mannose-1-phosphate guanylyltransferase/mannose-6-phosphate isomerase [Caulobacteraceae bacterium]|nr:mannose-1-phosphate guanylyltransferase/mannose-6-phosphate isomerase [Caulobacteraceae bacterium]